MVVGEGPGVDEDSTGRPFVGPAGQLLDKMLISIGLAREKNCFIANVVKCHPQGNRDPANDEVAACHSFLERQFTLLQPLLVLTVGRISTDALLHPGVGITRSRGVWREYHGVPALPTFHPSYLLRDPSKKCYAWQDLKTLSRYLATINAAYAAETESLRASWRN
jgi:DNA polymerase